MARNVSELDLLDLQKQGQYLYKQKKYEEALKYFDQVRRSRQPPDPLPTGVGNYEWREATR